MKNILKITLLVLLTTPQPSFSQEEIGEMEEFEGASEETAEEETANNTPSPPRESGKKGWNASQEKTDRKEKAQLPKKALYATGALATAGVAYYLKTLFWDGSSDTSLEFQKKVGNLPVNDIADFSDAMNDCFPGTNINYHLERDAHIMRQRGKVIGTFQCSVNDGFKEGKMIWSLCLHPDFRGQGLGKQLVQYAIHACQSNPQVLKPVALQVKEKNTRAINLYKKSGFRKYTKIFYPPKDDPYFWMRRDP